MRAEILAAILGSGVLSTIISGIFAIIQAHRSRKHGMVSAIRILLYDRIKHLGKHYIQQGCITYDDLEDFLKMHESYHNDVYGNGYLDSIVENVKKIKIVDTYDKEREE